MYFPFFLAYIGICFMITLVVFIWALKKGQFKDQDRARFLPLEDEPESEKVIVTPFNRFEAYGLIFLVIVGLALTVMVLFFSFFPDQLNR
jgi:cbb3-type cytochrome oxidase maturation protein